MNNESLDSTVSLSTAGLSVEDVSELFSCCKELKYQIGLPLDWAYNIGTGLRRSWLSGFRTKHSS